MRIVLVENKDGKRRIRWPQYLGVSFAFAVIMGCGVGLGHWLLTRRWSHEAALFGVCTGVTMVAWGAWGVNDALRAVFGKRGKSNE